jgi:hypothetical protein
MPVAFGVADITGRAAAIQRLVGAVMLRLLRANAGLLAVVSVVAAAVIRVAAHQYIEYDGWWHIFISRSDSWRNFYIDSQNTAHPPLYFLLLRTFSFLGTSRLAYRAVSIIAGLVAVFMVGKIAERITASRAIGALAAAGFGLSATNVVMSCEVRAYTLATAFMLVALYFYLRIVSLRGGLSDALGFSAAVIAGMLSLYAAAFFYVAAVCTPLVIALFRPAYRHALISYFRTRWILPATLAAPAAVLGVAYRYRIRLWAHPLNYMPQFYFDPGRGTWPAFVLNGVMREFNLFSPFAVTSQQMALPLAMALLSVAMVMLIVTLRARRVETAVPVVTLVLLIAQILSASLLQRFPFGGELRHQFLIFPFVILGLFSVAGVVERPAARHVILATLTILAAVNAISGALRFSVQPEDLFSSEVARFRQVALPAAAVYADEFSTIGLFSQYHDWKWHFAGSDGPNTLDYNVTKDGMSLNVVRVRNQWNLQPFDERLYRDLRRTMDRLHIRSVALLGLRILMDDPSPDDVRSRMTRAAAPQQLAVDRIVVDGRSLYARLARNAAAQAHAANAN